MSNLKKSCDLKGKIREFPHSQKATGTCVIHHLAVVRCVSLRRDRLKDVINKTGFHHKCTNPRSLLSSTACDRTLNLTGAEEVNQEQLLLAAVHIWPLRCGALPAALSPAPMCVPFIH